MAKNKKKSKAKTETNNVVEKEEVEEKVDANEEVQKTSIEDTGETNGEDANKYTENEPKNDSEVISNDNSENSEIFKLKEQVKSLTLQVQERDQQLEKLKDQPDISKSDDESNGIISKEKYEEVVGERDQIQSQYDTLLSRLSSMKSIFSKMKESENELEEAKETIVRLNKQIDEVKSNKPDEDIIKKLSENNEDLNNECDRLSTALSKSRREYQAQIDELQDEKYNLENQNSKLTKKNHELKQEINEVMFIKDELAMEKKNLASKIDELEELRQSKVDEIKGLGVKLADLESKALEQQQNSLKLVEEKDTEIAQLSQKVSDLTEKIAQKEAQLVQSQAKLSQLKEELSELDKLKVDLNNKQLLIGKLRHEAVILNEHLTKSLTMLKKQGSEEKHIDKELISNVLISFLQIPRGDTKKFETLQLISGLLEWDASQKVAAGLSHTPGAGEEEKGTRQSFVSLWTDFLDRESKK